MWFIFAPLAGETAVGALSDGCLLLAGFVTFYSLSFAGRKLLEKTEEIENNG